MAIENGVQNAELGYILDPAFQIENLNGKPVVGGYICIYEAGTDNKYISYENFDGAQNPFKIPLKADGRAVILGDPSLTYDVYAYDSYGNQLFSRLNVQCNVPGNISIKGADTRINNTDGTLDVSLRTLGNNVRQYTINTHNKVLDVQEPLYFVENSNTATVIGFSGDNYATTADLAGKMDESKLEYNNDGEISAYDGSAFAGQGGAGDPEVNDLVHSNSATWNDVSAKLDTTAFSTVSGNFLTAIPDDYATKDYVQSSVSSKLDSTAFSTVSGSFLTAHQDLSDYLTKVSADGLYYPLNSNPSGYLTAHQSLAGYLTKTSADTLYQPKGNYADATALDGKVDTSSFTAFSSTTNEKIEYISGALSGTYELSAGNGIDITDYPNEQKTVISVTAQGGNPEVEAEVIAHSADWNTVGDKLDTTAFSTVSGDFLTAHQDISDLMPKSESANFYPMTGNPSGFVTSGELPDPVTIGVQEGDTLDTDYDGLKIVKSTYSNEHINLHKKSTDQWLIHGGLVPTSPGSNKYLITDNSGTMHWNNTSALAYNSAFEQSGGYITAYNGSAFKAGDELPSGVMNESALEYNAVNEISGYNGSAIAQYGAEKQWLQHDDTIVHVANSAQYAFGCNISALQRLMGIDETVLWSGSANTGTLNLTEPLTSFKEFKFYVYVPERGTNQVLTYYDAVNTVNPGFLQLTMNTMTTGSVISDWWQGVYNINGTVNTATYKSFSIYANGQYYKQCSTTACGTNDSRMVIKKIVGIGRKEV